MSSRDLRSSASGPLPAANHAHQPSAAAPALPSQMSPDGREVWAWADAFSRHTHRMNRLRELRSDHFLCGRECGDCDKWMKSRECPREHNVNGQSRGPSCKGAICSQFVWSRSAERRRDRLAAEIAALSETPPPAVEAQASGLAAGSHPGSSPQPREDQ